MTDLLLNGRIVQGSLSTPETKNREGQPLTNTDGSPRVRYYIGLAIPKTSPEWPVFVQNVQAAAQAGHPTVMNAPGFSWKYFDGDGIDSKGLPYATREGMAGHWIVNLSSGFPPKCYSSMSGPLAEITADQIKRGYYAEVNWSTKANTSATSPGVYVNLHMVRLTGYGAEIVGGADPTEVFAGAAPLPAGASAVPLGAVVPLATPAAIPPAMAAAVIPGAAPIDPAAAAILAAQAAQAAATQAATVQATVAAIPAGIAATVAAAPPQTAAAPVAVAPGPAAVIPNTAVMAPATALTVPTPGGAVLGKYMTAKAGTTTYEQFIAKGWTDTQLFNEGYLDEPPF